MSDFQHGHGQPLLTVEGLSVVFDGSTVPAVDGASWELHAGRVTALVGESGSGKSVTASAVLGLLPETAHVSGRLRYAGQGRPGGEDAGPLDLVGADAETLRAVRGDVLALVSQEPMSAWNPVLRVGDQIAEAVGAHRRVRRAAARATVVGLLADAGLDEPERIARSFPHQLSGGQLQRALIAMALAQEPAVIVADEPTTALDVTVQAGILDLLRRLRDRGTAILLITHDMGVVADLADDVVVMQAGRVIESAAVADLFAAPSDPGTRALLEAVPLLGAGEGAAGPGPADDPQSPASPPAVRVSGLRVRYRGDRRREVRAVDGVDLAVAPGQILGIVGESGSGKSTLGLVVAGLLRPTAGEVSVDGVDLAGADRTARRALRRRTGIVFQDPAATLDPRWTVARSIAEPLRQDAGMERGDRERRVGELLDMVRLDPSYGGRYPHELSGGQRQRVAIARALALRPTVLVADEPTSALDVSVQAHVLRLLAELHADLRFTCLFISHDLAVVEQVADRVAVLRGGKVVEEGPTGRVLASPRDPYTQRLVEAAPVPDPERQARRRSAAEDRALA